jgi:exodeoxyribonuclease V alpha subunit
MRTDRPGSQADDRGDGVRTIHRLLEADPQGGGFRRSDDNPLDCDLLVVDETSMVDARPPC